MTVKNKKKSLKKKSFTTKQRKKIIRGLQTGWLEAGTPGKTIFLMLHGFPDEAHVWNHQINYFSKKYHVIAPFLRGVGPSNAQWNENRYHISSVTLDLFEILREVDPQGKQNIIVMGHDIGTAYAWHMAHLLGPRLKGLIILNGAHFVQLLNRILKNAQQFIKSWYLYYFFLPILPSLTLKLMPFALKKKFLENSGSPKSYLKKYPMGLKQSHESVKHYRNLWTMLLNFFNERTINKISAPVLSLSASNDNFVEAANLKELEALTEHPTVRVIEGKHWIQQENPDRVNRLINKFLKESV